MDVDAQPREPEPPEPRSITPRRMRRPWVIGVVLISLLGVIGAVIAAFAPGGGEPATLTPSLTPSPTFTPSPSPSLSPVTPAAAPSADAGVVVLPFGGSCADALSEDVVDALRGIGMTRTDYVWQSGAKEVLGGIDCVWVSDESFLEATVHVFAYPESSVPASVTESIADGCEPVEGYDSRVECSTSGVVDGTWLLVRAVGPNDQISAPGVDVLYADSARRLADHPSAAPATRASDWWALPDCAALVEGVDPAVYGYERVEEFDDGMSSAWLPDRIPGLAGASRQCGLNFVSGIGDSLTGELVWLEVVPGGAQWFSTALSAGSETAEVDGAVGAVRAPGLDRYEGSWGMLVVSDGVNVLMVGANGPAETADLARLSAAVLALL